GHIPPATGHPPAQAAQRSVARVSALRVSGPRQPPRPPRARGRSQCPGPISRDSPARSSPVFLEGHLAIVLAQEIQKALVFALLHVEEPRHDLVVAARFLQALPYEIADVAPRDLALHVQRVDRVPERLALVEQL